MNEFLLLALLVVYLVISYVPISEGPKGTWTSHQGPQNPGDGAQLNTVRDAENRHLWATFEESTRGRNRRVNPSSPPRRK